MSTPRRPRLAPQDIAEALDKAFPMFNSEVAFVRIEEQLNALTRLVEKQGAQLENVEAEFKSFRSLRDKGLGWLAGVAIAGGVIGAAFKSIWQTVFGGGG